MSKPTQKEKDLARKIALVSQAITEGMENALHNRFDEDKKYLESIRGQDLKQVRKELEEQLYAL
jgi:hypothetical protein